MKPYRIESACTQPASDAARSMGLPLLAGAAAVALYYLWHLIG